MTGFRASVQERAGAQISPSEYNLDQLHDLGYTIYDGKPILGLDGVVDHIDSGYVQAGASDGVITYTFAVSNHITGLFNNPHYGLPDSGYGYSRFTVEQQAAGREAIQLWDDLIPQTFVEQRGLGNADITLANSLDPAQAYAFYPTDDAHGLSYAGDLFTNDPNAENWTNNWFGNLGYGDTTLVHELGHTLGLSHPGAYNYDPNVTQDYAGLAEYAQDSTQYSIMSYWDPSETGARIVNWNTLLFGYAQTPMLHDVLAIQQKYGADPTTRAGDTVYGFHSNADNDLFDFAENPYPFLTVYDAAGHDTIDLSGYNVSQFVDLHAGAFSSIGGGAPDPAQANAQLAELSHISGQDWGTYDAATAAVTNQVMANYMNANANSIAGDLAITGHAAVSGIATSEYQNFSIAYGVTIEDAIGGSARDLLWGNEVANTLQGMGGDDVLNGFEGADTLYGGAGNDTFMFSHVETGDRVMDWNAGDHIDLREMDANSAMAGLQHFAFVGDHDFSGTAGELHYVNGVLEGDVNGDGVADFAVMFDHSPVIGSVDLILG